MWRNNIYKRGSLVSPRFAEQVLDSVALFSFLVLFTPDQRKIPNNPSARITLPLRHLATFVLYNLYDIITWHVMIRRLLPLHQTHLQKRFTRCQVFAKSIQRNKTIHSCKLSFFYLCIVILFFCNSVATFLSVLKKKNCIINSTGTLLFEMIARSNIHNKFAKKIYYMKGKWEQVIGLNYNPLILFLIQCSKFCESNLRRTEASYSDAKMQTIE